MGIFSKDGDVLFGWWPWMSRRKALARFEEFAKEGIKQIDVLREEFEARVKDVEVIWGRRLQEAVEEARADERKKLKKRRGAAKKQKGPQPGAHLQG